MGTSDAFFFFSYLHAYFFSIVTKSHKKIIVLASFLSIDILLVCFCLT